MGYEVINGVINRPVLSGYEFNDLFPASNCEIIKTSHGKGCVGIREVITWSRKHIRDTKDISDFFVSESLKNTCNLIQDFLYSHIQYSYNDVYNVKSPACVWASRNADCKSFSVFASTVLLNLGIKHYFRAVNYEGEGEHIYVIIPKNQEFPLLNEDSKFNEDYYIIDGTTNDYKESKYDLKRVDILMNPDDLESELIKCVDDKKTNYVIIGLTIITTILLFSRNTET
ncbi:hypothetical protein [Mariniflexile sp. HMF6888]|uniref:hypothetical protein n=1 Tax=Mariniflexile sp. HMF6888 TaxID=3373086 RepID=UPI003789FD1D